MKIILPVLIVLIIASLGATYLFNTCSEGIFDGKLNTCTCKGVKVPNSQNDVVAGLKYYSCFGLLQKDIVTLTPVRSITSAVPVETPTLSQERNPSWPNPDTYKDDLRENVKSCKNNKSDLKDTDIEALLNDIKVKSGAKFLSAPVKGSFSWNLPDQENPIDIQGFVISGVYSLDSADYENATKIDTYFENNGFIIDSYNIATGTVSGLEGYYKECIRCMNSGEAVNRDLETRKHRISLSCGILK